MSALRRQKAILPWWQLALVVGAASVGVWLLLPDHLALIDNLLRDGKPKEARRLLETLTPAERARQPDHFRLLAVRTARLELPAVGAPTRAVSVTRFWSESTTAWRESAYSGEIASEFTPLIPHLADLTAAFDQIAADLPKAATAQRTRLTGEFQRAALAANQPALAAAAFALAHPLPARASAESLELARLWQLSGRSADALAALGDAPDAALVTRRIALLRSLNRNREALALLRAHVETAPPSLPVAEELAAVALAAGEPAGAAPYLSRYLAAHPGDLSVHRRLRDLFVAAGQPAAALASARQAVALGSRQPADVRDLARIYEFTTQPALAFDTWLELALSAPPRPPSTANSDALTAGHLTALDRLVALNPGLYRDADLARALAKLAPIPGRPDYLLLLARLDVSLGRFDEARFAFERYLAAVPTDADALVDFAHLNRELYLFAEAEPLLRRAAALRPSDPALGREVAELLVAQNRHLDALAAYRQLLPTAPSEEILGPYIRLAESLGRYDDFTRGLRLRIDLSPTPSARDFLLLAYGYELTDDDVRRQAALDEGLRRSTDSDDLRLQLAFVLSAERKYAAAQAALTPHTGRHSHAPAATLYLELLRLNNDTAAERRYLAQPLAPALVHDESIVDHLARAHEALRNYAEAERLWRELTALRPTEFVYTAGLARVLLLRRRAAEAQQLLAPFLREPTPAILKLAAEIATAAGDHRSAEKYQLAYLDAVRTAPAADWGALGDMRLSRGDRTGAKRAYSESLRRLLAQLAKTGGSE
jgi:predicted Zn-dependent protease